MKQISGCVAIVTGASSGIGHAVALEFAKKKAKAVVLVARSTEKLSELQREIENFGTSALALPTDIRNAVQVKEMVKQTIERFGKVDVLVNSAGIFYPHTVLHIDYAHLQDTMDTNFYGTVYCTQSVLPYMVKQGNGQIVNIASSAVEADTPFHSSYSSSKYAVVGYSRVVRRELENCGIKVLIVYPAFIETPMLKEDIASLQPPMNLSVVKVIKPEKAAVDVVNAIESGKEEVFPGVPFGYIFLNNLLGGKLADYLVSRIYGGCKVVGEDKEWRS